MSDEQNITSQRAAWERPALVRMDAADARNSPTGVGADRGGARVSTAFPVGS